MPAFRLRPLAALCLALSVPALAGAQAARYYPDEAGVRALRYAAWEAGTLFSTTATPYLRADLEAAARRAAAGDHHLSPQAVAALSAFAEPKAAARLALGPGMALDAGLAVGLAAFLRSDYSGSAPSSFGWAERPPLLEIPLGLGVGDALRLEGSLELREDHNAIRLPVDPANWSTWIETPDYIDYTFPFKALMYYEDGPASAALGRDRLRWGPGLGGTMLISDAPDFYDFASFGFSSPVFNYRFLWVSLDNALSSKPDAYPDGLDKEVDPLDFESDKVAAWTKNLFIHRYEITFFDRLYLGVVEGLMVGGVPVDLAYLNPLLILHNRYPWKNAVARGYVPASSALGLELRLNPWRYGELYGSFLMNQFQTAYELDTYAADHVPNAFGWLAGVDLALPFRGGWIVGGAEFSYANPWLYVRENRFNSFYWGRQLSSNVGVAGKSQYAGSSIGLPYGPDSLAFLARLGWDAPGRLRAALSFEYSARGQNRLFETAYAEGEDAAKLKTPSGVAERRVGAGLSVEWEASPRYGLSGGVRWAAITNYGNQEGARASYLDLSLGLTLRYPAPRDGSGR